MKELSIKLGILVVAIFSWVSAEEKKMGPYKMIIEGINPRSFDGKDASYVSDVRPLNKSDKSDKRFFIDFEFHRDIKQIGAKVTVSKDKSQNKAKDWNNEGSFEVKKICECEYGLKAFLEHFEPQKLFDTDVCGIFKGKATVHEWTMDHDLHDAFDQLVWGYYNIHVCLSDNYDMQSQQMDFSECFLQFEVTGDIIDAGKKEKKKCKKDDKDCKKKKKKDKDKDEDKDKDQDEDKEK